MWTEIDTQISQVTGDKFNSIQRRSISGGCINQGYAISNGERSFFVKINQASQIAMFEAEILGLKQISATNTIKVPQPICSGVTNNACYLVLEWLQLGGGGSKSWQQLGKDLAALHQAKCGEKFGWDINNTIGSTVQINTWADNWVEFYTHQRLEHQFKLCRMKGAFFSQAEKLLAAIPKLLHGHQVKPSLVHGDLWGGNAGCTVDGIPVIYDPATYIGDREVDIAMTELFGGFPSAFYQGYQEVYPLEAGYEKRKTLYNLYHILNHFNLFGGGYKSQANSMISQLLT
jgi:fructosamine-3-kinase